MNRPEKSPYAVRCRCGHEMANQSVQSVRRYSFFGVMCLLMGYTPLPVRIEFQCTTCGTVFDTITNKRTLERFRYDEPGPGDK